MIFDTVAKLAGLTVVFDPDFTSRRIAAELTNVTIEQALDIVSLEAKAFWKPVTNNIIFVAPDQAQKRRDYEEEVVRTIYLKNTILPQDLTEIVNGLRQLLDLRRVQQFNAQNAIIVRDTPDKVMLAEKIIEDIDKPKAGSRRAVRGAAGAARPHAGPGHQSRDQRRQPCRWLADGPSSSTTATSCGKADAAPSCVCVTEISQPGCVNSHRPYQQRAPCCPTANGDRPPAHLLAAPATTISSNSPAR